LLPNSQLVYSQPTSFDIRVALSLREPSFADTSSALTSVSAHKCGIGIGIANYTSSSADAKELRGNLYAAAKKPVLTLIGGQVYILRVRVSKVLARTPSR
jgi:hypothetical protein